MSHCESPYYRIGLGYCGPTDCALTLSFINETKEYGIESEAWRVLSTFWDIQTGSAPLIPKDSYKGAILTLVWKHCDSDLL